MRPILYLYPKRWRDRYADEMDQLLDDAPLTGRGAMNLALHAATVRLADGATLGSLSAVLAIIALLPVTITGYLWLTYVVLQNPLDAAVISAAFHRLPPSPTMTLLALVLAIAPMLQSVTHALGRSTLRVRWRSYPVHAAIALVAAANIAMIIAQLYDQAWHVVAQWYWATCATSCHEPWMSPVSFAGTLYPWILLPPAAWVAWRRARRWSDR